MFALKIAKFLNRYLLSPKSGSSSLAASGSLSEPLSYWVPVPAGPGPGAAPGLAWAAEVMDTIRYPDAAAAAVWAAAVVLPGPPFAAAARALGPPAAAARSRRPLLPVSGRGGGGPGQGLGLL